MKPKSSAPCVLSMVFGIIIFPLQVIAYYMAFIAASYNWYYSDKFMGSMLSVIAIALYVVIGLLIIAGIVLGIIGIKQRRPKKGMAVAGIIICSLMIVATFCQYGCLYIMPKISIMLSEADNQIYETLPR